MLISPIVLLSLGRHLCWWSISPKGYHPPKSQHWQIVLLSLGRHLCWWSISPKGYHPPKSQHWQILLLSLGRHLCWWSISPKGYHPPKKSVLTWFIRYIIMIEINHPKTCTPPGFQISCLWAYLMKFIQKRVVRTKFVICVFRFLTPPQSFITHHFPYINNNIEEIKQWKLLENPFTLDVYSKSIKTSKQARYFGI